MSRYMTKQRKILLDYLSLHPDESLSAYRIAEDLSDKDISISAVYRNLSILEQEGLIRRIGISGSREVYYQYIGAKKCRECLHLSCMKCGKTFHLEDETTTQILKQVAQNDQFRISKEHTILYGVCKNCVTIQDSTPAPAARYV